MSDMIVAIDPGFGNVKGVADGKAVIMPSVVAVPAGPLGLAGMGMKAARKARRVAFDRGDFYVGPGARSWGHIVENMDFSRLASPEAEALLYAVLAELAPDGASVRMILGLPVPLLRDEAVARPALEALRARLVREHRFEVDGKAFSLRITALKAAAQPVGAWADWALDGEGRWANPAAKGALVGVMDLGFNTLDLYGIQGGRLEPRLVGGDKVGVRRLLDLSAPDLPYHEADERLRAGRIRSDDARNVWLSEVLGAAERVWNAARLDLVLLVGGGALLLRDRQDVIRRAFRAEVVIPEDPVTANARGLWKWSRTLRW
ncbi:ParM/StbA family protein [Thermoflexus sp.]|uniref:ParM/StbA family protein n=1 Tax=Thermoflexus sp. TaxID=1969742 RepID=UPI002ADE1797|nr:ParM/StbA family protein [Thermoflexus sp.]